MASTEALEAASMADIISVATVLIPIRHIFGILPPFF